MKIRLGYACVSNSLNATSSSPYTYKEYKAKGNIDKLDKVIISNLEDLEKIIDYNIKNNIHFYRMSSKIIPLASKDDVCFDYTNKYSLYYKRIGNKINKSGMRVDFHPDQYCVLNSTNSDVISNTIKELEYLYSILNILGIKYKTLILHVGSGVLGKDNSIRRFINSYNRLPEYLKKCIVIENDDKVFNVSDVMRISDSISVPVVLDYHHYKCNKSDIDIKKIFDTWGEVTPKVHFSSPRNSRDYRSHNDYIDSDDFIDFIEMIKEYDKDVDIMIEAKMKDDALFRLVRELKYKTNYYFIDDTSFII